MPAFLRKDQFLLDLKYCCINIANVKVALSGYRPCIYRRTAKLNVRVILTNYARARHRLLPVQCSGLFR